MRKSANPQVSEALEDWLSLTEIRYELAEEAYKHQDAATQILIDKMVLKLRSGATGRVVIDGVSVKVDQVHLDQNLLYVATEILKDLAMFDIRVGTYELPPSQCVGCGAEIEGGHA